MLLALDSATPLVTVAAYADDTVLAEAVAQTPMRHGEQLAPLIEQVLAAAGARPADLTEIVVGTGPGPFTGLRVGLVTARMLGWALDIPVSGVCTLDVIAAEVVAAGAPSDGFAVATDARRREVYWASYDAAGRRQVGPVVARPSELPTAIAVAGGGAVLYGDHFRRAIGPDRPGAGWLARIRVHGPVEVTAPEPLYLRRPDAAVPAAPKPVS